MMLAIAKQILKYAVTFDRVQLVETTSKNYYGARYQDVQNRVPAIENTITELGWKPTIAMNDALSKIFEACHHNVDKARHLVK